MIRNFNSKISLLANWQNATDIDNAAWTFASEDHREEYRDSGKLPHRSAALLYMRIQDLAEALSEGELIALGIRSDDPNLEIYQIPQVAFGASDLKIDNYESTIAVLGRRFIDVKVCRSAGGKAAHPETQNELGRPNLLPMILEAWASLKIANAQFLEFPKERQNREIQDKVAELNPGRFHGNSKPGESTIRRHRRLQPSLFT